MSPRAAGQTQPLRHSLPDHFVETLPVLRRGALAAGHFKQSVSNCLVVKLFQKRDVTEPRSVTSACSENVEPETQRALGFHLQVLHSAHRNTAHPH